MAEPILIGFGHRARHGKDSAARFIHEEYPKDTKVYSFAAALRAVCRAVLGMREKHGPLLQLVGTEVFRMPRGMKRSQAIYEFIQKYPEFKHQLNDLADIVTTDENVWVRSLQDLINEDQPRVALITDMRFPNEAAIMDATIKVTRWVEAKQGNGVLVPFVAPDRPADHASEIALDDYKDWTEWIHARDGNMDELRNEALASFNKVLTNIQNERRLRRAA